MCMGFALTWASVWTLMGPVKFILKCLMNIDSTNPAVTGPGALPLKVNYALLNTFYILYSILISILVLLGHNSSEFLAVFWYDMNTLQISPWSPGYHQRDTLIPTIYQIMQCLSYCMTLTLLHSLVTPAATEERFHSTPTLMDGTKVIHCNLRCYKMAIKAIVACHLHWVTVLKLVWVCMDFGFCGFCISILNAPTVQYARYNPSEWYLMLLVVFCSMWWVCGTQSLIWLQHHLSPVWLLYWDALLFRCRFHQTVTEHLPHCRLL